MGFFRHFNEALVNIMSAKLRSSLAILGILVGTAAIVSLTTSSQLATQHALAEFKTLGTQLISVNFSYPERNRSAATTVTGLTLADVNGLALSIPSIETAAPYTFLFQNRVYRGHDFQGPVIGATRALSQAAKITLSQGRFIDVFDKSSPYCVIGAELADQLKKEGLQHPLGEQILIGGKFFTIVGVAKPVAPNLFVYLDINQGVIIPLETTYLLSNLVGISNLLIKLKPEVSLANVQPRIQHYLKALLPAAEIALRNPQQILDLIKKQQATFAWLLVAIGGISLFVGGIGIMNIMLVSVIERRREIGIRLAVGAQQGDILALFLIEAVVLTLLGGVLGILVGGLISFVLAYFSRWEFYFLLWPPLLGFFVSIFVGILSGFYPALRASRLDPILSLRAD